MKNYHQKNEFYRNTSGIWDILLNKYFLTKFCINSAVKLCLLGDIKKICPLQSFDEAILCPKAVFLNCYEAQESIPPAHVAWRAGSTTLFLPGS
jgi:hypothetical protein